MKTKSRNMTFMLYLTAVFSMLFMLVSNSAVAAIAGSAHDLSDKSFTGGAPVAGGVAKGDGEICVVCHVPHNTDTANTTLWNHDASTIASYTVYDSPTLDAKGGAATIGQPTGVSKLCLSCHDGSVSVDSFGGTQGGADSPMTLPAELQVGAVGDLSNDHPISFTYDDALATADNALWAPSSTSVLVGDAGVGGKTKSGSIDDVMLYGGQVQCASCHDVHNNYTATNRLLKVTMAGSQLCLTCHNK